VTKIYRNRRISITCFLKPISELEAFGLRKCSLILFDIRTPNIGCQISPTYFTLTVPIYDRQYRYIVSTSCRARNSGTVLRPPYLFTASSRPRLLASGCSLAARKASSLFFMSAIFFLLVRFSNSSCFLACCWVSNRDSATAGSAEETRTQLAAAS
jgi:hypothetical protein